MVQMVLAQWWTAAGTYSSSKARLLNDQKWCDMGAKCFLPISDPFLWAGLQAMKMEVCKSRPEAFKSCSALILHIACGLLNSVGS